MAGPFPPDFSPLREHWYLVGLSLCCGHFLARSPLLWWCCSSVLRRRSPFFGASSAAITAVCFDCQQKGFIRLMERRHHETQGGKSGYRKAKSVSRAHHPTDRGAFSHVGGTGCYGVAPVSLCAGQNGRNDAGMVGDTLSPAGRGVVVLRTASSVLVQMLWVPCGHGGRDHLEMPFYADSAAEKDGDSIYWHRLPLAGFGAKSGYACRYGVFSTKSYPQECRNKSYLLRNKRDLLNSRPVRSFAAI